MALSNENSERWNAVKDTTARVARGTVAGFMGGVIAAWVMNQYQEVESRPVNVRKLEKLKVIETPAETATKIAESDNGAPTVKVAQMVSRKLIHHELTPAEKKIAGPTVHFGYGGAVGALYGGLAELLPTVSIGMGIPYATLLWLAGDEIALPALDLAKFPHEVPLEKHASEIATHFVYGITLDISRRILRRLI